MPYMEKEQQDHGVKLDEQRMTADCLPGVLWLLVAGAGLTLFLSLRYRKYAVPVGLTALSLYLSYLGLSPGTQMRLCSTLLTRAVTSQHAGGNT